jgi:molybdopterin converting factor small subunit
VKPLLVKLFAKARDLAGEAVIEVPWHDGETVSVLKQRLVENCPDLILLVPRLLVAVNSKYATDNTTLNVADEVACFPPVSGG